jgi:hypothetical protein
LDEDCEDVEHHVAERVPVERVIEERAQIVEAVEPPPSEGAQVPVRESDVEPEEGREDHHRDGEQKRRKEEQGPPSGLAVNHHEPGAQGDHPGKKGVEDRPPVLEADLDDAGRLQDLDEERCGEREGEQPDQPSPGGPQTRRHVLGHDHGLAAGQR